MQPIRVLLIHDDVGAFTVPRDSTRELAHGSFEIDEAPSYQAGVAELGRRRHDVVLVRDRASIHSGFELLREAARIGVEAPIILLGEDADEGAGVRALREGAADYLDEPRVTPSLLAGAIRYAVERAKSARAQRDLQDARRSEQFQRQVLSMVGHDLKSPLTAVMTSLELIARSGEIPARFERALARSIGSCRRIDRILRDLADYTQIRMGHFELVRQPTTLRAICTKAVERMRALYPERTVSQESDAEVPGVWDGARLRQSVESLIENALKHGSRDGAVRVTWAAAPAGANGDGDRAVLRVHNPGAPIPDDVLQHLFEPFHRGSDAAQTIKTSSGLGLFITREIVTAHGGDIAFTSEEGAGTEVVITLPLRAAG